MAENFSVARGVIRVVEIVGWLAVALGGLAALAGATNDEMMAGLAVGAALALAGLLQVVAVQLARAQIATAESTAEMVALLRASDARRPGPAQPATPRAVAAPRPVPASGQVIGGVIKRYKGRPIVQEADGVSIDGEGSFANVIAAERHIDGKS